GLSVAASLFRRSQTGQIRIPGGNHRTGSAQNAGRLGSPFADSEANAGSDDERIPANPRQYRVSFLNSAYTLLDALKPERPFQGFPNNALIRRPIAVGVSTTSTPAALSAATLLFPVPLPPVMMAPA